jgi:hypothetical protein
MIGDVADEIVLVLEEDVLAHFKTLHKVELPSQILGLAQIHLSDELSFPVKIGLIPYRIDFELVS